MFACVHTRDMSMDDIIPEKVNINEFLMTRPKRDSAYSESFASVVFWGGAGLLCLIFDQHYLSSVSCNNRCTIFSLFLAWFHGIQVRICCTYHGFYRSNQRPQSQPLLRLPQWQQIP